MDCLRQQGRLPVRVVKCVPMFYDRVTVVVSLL